jgi:hypothetical protein
MQSLNNKLLNYTSFTGLNKFKNFGRGPEWRPIGRNDGEELRRSDESGVGAG